MKEEEILTEIAKGKTDTKDFETLKSLFPELYEVYIADIKEGIVKGFNAGQDSERERIEKLINEIERLKLNIKILQGRVDRLNEDKLK